MSLSDAYKLLIDVTLDTRHSGISSRVHSPYLEELLLAFRLGCSALLANWLRRWQGFLVPVSILVSHRII